MENNKKIKTNSQTSEQTNKQIKNRIITFNSASKLTQGHHGNCFEMMRYAETIFETNKD